MKLQLVTLIFTLLYKIDPYQACSVFCPSGEDVCTCPDGKPKPTPDPTGFINQNSCEGLIHYCSVGGECRPEENGCPETLDGKCEDKHEHCDSVTPDNCNDFEVLKQQCPLKCGICVPNADPKRCAEISPLVCKISPSIAKECPKACGLSKNITAGCTLSGGEHVEEGWRGKDTGNNFCNSCSCSGERLVCTEMWCTNIDLTAGCTLSGGEHVKEGWTGRDTGNNFCNSCSCNGEGLRCTEKLCRVINPTANGKRRRRQVGGGDTGLRLIGGNTKYQGNVFIGDKPVCDDEWDENDGAVVCRELGYGALYSVFNGSRFGNVPDVHAMNEVACTGSEIRLHNCRHEVNGDCGPGKGAGVECVGDRGGCGLVCGVNMVRG